MPFLKNSMLAACLFLFAFCQKKGAEPTVPDEKMTAVLADCFAVESAIQQADVVAKDSLTKKYVAQVFEIHQVEKAEFESSLEAVARQPARLDSILARAERQLKKVERSPSDTTQKTPQNAQK